MLKVAARHQAPNGFNLDLRFRTEAGITALFGPSGAGKTSLIEMIAGIKSPHQGRIELSETVLFDSSAGTDLSPQYRQIGYVPQDTLLFPHLTVRDNLNFGARYASGEPLMKFEALAELLGLTPLLNRFPTALSGGEQRRTAIGRALLAQPKLLLLDEPTNGLDQILRQMVRDLVATIQAQTQIPILFITHQLEDVIDIADQMIIIDNGAIIADTDVFEALGRPDLRHYTGDGEAGALLNCNVARMDGGDGLSQLRFDGGTLWVGQVQLPIDSPVRVRIRAADIALAKTRPTDSSVLNILSAEIDEIIESDGYQADVLLKVGATSLWARITRRSLSSLDLKPGDPVQALIKSVALDRRAHSKSLG